MRSRSRQKRTTDGDEHCTRSTHEGRRVPRGPAHLSSAEVKARGLREGACELLRVHPCSPGSTRTSAWKRSSRMRLRSASPASASSAACPTRKHSHVLPCAGRRSCVSSPPKGASRNARTGSCFCSVMCMFPSSVAAPLSSGESWPWSRKGKASAPSVQKHSDVLTACGSSPYAALRVRRRRRRPALRKLTCMYGGLPARPSRKLAQPNWQSRWQARTPGGAGTYAFTSSSVWSHSYTARPEWLTTCRVRSNFSEHARALSALSAPPENRKQQTRRDADAAAAAAPPGGRTRSGRAAAAGVVRWCGGALASRGVGPSAVGHTAAPPPPRS